MSLPSWKGEQEDVKPLFNVTLIAKIKDVDILLGMTTLKDQIITGRAIYFIYNTLEEFDMADFIKDLTICSPLLDISGDRHTVWEIVSLLEDPREVDDDTIIFDKVHLDQTTYPPDCNYYRFIYKYLQDRTYKLACLNSWWGQFDLHNLYQS